MNIVNVAFPNPIEEVPFFMLDTKYQRNNVHGFINLNHVERECIDTPEFQRLRYIKQLGFAHLIYETAEHSRFAHSTGVCHLTKLLVDIINRNHRIEDQMAIEFKEQVCPAEENQLFIPINGATSAPLDIRLAIPRIAWAQRFCLGIAALLHDLPHPPFSHALEHECAVMVKHDKVDQNPQLYQYLFGDSSNLSQVLKRYSKKFKDYLSIRQTLYKEHFVFNDSDIKQYLKRNELKEEDLLSGLVFEMLAFKSEEDHPHGTFRYLKNWADIETETYHTFHFSSFFKPYFSDIIASTICSDLLDYLQRDSLNTGIERKVEAKFLDRIRVKDVKVPQNFRPRVVYDMADRRGGVRKDTLTDLISLLESRYILMERVYIHRTKLAASAMLVRAFLTENVLPHDLYNLDKYSSDDSLLRHILHNGNTPAKNLVRKILSRKIYKPLFVIDESVCRKAAVHLRKADLAKAFRPTCPALGGKSSWENIVRFEQRMAFSLNPSGSREDGIHPDYPIILFCMEENVAYKDPTVLVSVPSNTIGEEPKFEKITDVRSIFLLLSHLMEDDGAAYQMESMVNNYDKLWKFFVFADMDFVDAHSNMIPWAYSELVSLLGRTYPVEGLYTKWFGFDALKAVLNFETQTSPKVADRLAKITGQSEHTWKSRIKEYNVSVDQEANLWERLKPRLTPHITDKNHFNNHQQILKTIIKVLEDFKIENYSKTDSKKA